MVDPRYSGGRDGRRPLEAQVAHGCLAHLELLDLAGHGHGEAVDKLPVTRNLVGGDLAATERREVVLGGMRAFAELDPGHDLFAVALTRNADDLDVADIGMG